METLVSNPVLLGEELLDLLRERADKQFKGKLEQAFVDWYVEAEFGEDANRWTFCDGANDGGIDALVWLKDPKLPVVVIQSKFNYKISAKTLGRNAYEKFREVVDLFYSRDEVWTSPRTVGAPEGLIQTGLERFGALIS